MDTLFPFGLPGATGLYAVLYVVGLALHWLCMQTMLGGSLYLAVRAVSARGETAPDPVAASIRSWMPFTVSIAITTGIAPLLFQQILYRKGFYTANLLLPYRYMLIAPVLIAVLYLLYVMKSNWIAGRPRAARVLPLLVLASLLLVAATWIEGHRLAVQDAEVWKDVYLRQPALFLDAQVAPRLLWWLGLSMPLTAWIWVRTVRDEASAEARAASRRVARYALAGLGVAIAAAIWHAFEPAAHAAWGRTTSIWQPYAALLVVGLAGIGWSWVRALRGRTGGVGLRLLFAAFVVLGAAVLREAMRFDAVDIAALAQGHADAGEKGGAFALLVFAPLGTFVVVRMLRAVRRDLQAGSARPTD